MTSSPDPTTSNYSGPVANGTIRRGLGGSETSPSTSIFAGHYLDSEHVRLQLRRLTREDLILMPISGPPSPPRGRHAEICQAATAWMSVRRCCQAVFSS
jgi:hypothetical protein